MDRLTVTPMFGAEAIAYARTHGLLLSRYRDATGPARTGMTPDEAEEVGDKTLIYLHVRGLEAT